MTRCQLNTFFLTTYLATHSKPSKKWGKSVQLAEVHLYRSYFLQNPYFNCFYLNFLKVVKNDECFQIHTKRALLLTY